MKMPDEMRRKVLANDEGSDWLYWDVKVRVWRRVVLLAVPSDDPKRVRVQHLDTEMKGSAEWVPAGRLHVPWAVSDKYLASVESVGRLESHAPRAFVVDLATLLLSDYIDQSVADLFRNGASGVLEVRDLAALTALLGPDGSDYLNHPDAVCDRNRAFLPWQACERILTALIAKDPLPAMRLLDERTRRQQKFDSLVDREGERWWMRTDETGSEARRLRQWHDDGLEAIATLERWLDADTPSLASSYIELRGMYDDLAAAARQAIPRVRMVRAHISERLADRLQEMVDRPTPLLDIQGLRRIRHEGEDETDA